jgi:hypothetical protein
VQGHFRVLYLYDVCESIQLEKLRTILLSGTVDAKAIRTLPIPHYLKFERPPVTEPIGLMVLESGEMIEGRIKYYDYGVVSIEMELKFEGDWESLVSQSSRWIGAPELEAKAKELLRGAIEHADQSIMRPYKTYLNEDYFIVQLNEVLDANGMVLGAKDLLASHAREIAQLVRGESVFLSDAETQEVLQSSISYSRTDLLVVGWSGALVYGGKESALTTIQLLEYANTQLLEFRFYDSLLTQVLDDVYRSLEHKGGVASAWRLSRQAARLNTLRLDVMELTEKVDNAIKFLSDMFFARLYGLAAAKVGVADYRRLVDQKLRTAGELYRFMVDQFNQTRSFVLELAIVIILIIEIVFLFRGR